MLNMEKEKKSAYIEVLDYNRIISFYDNRSLKDAIERDLEEDLQREGFQFSDIILQVQSTDDKFGGKFVDLRDQDVPDQRETKAAQKENGRPTLVNKMAKFHISPPQHTQQCSTSEDIFIEAQPAATTTSSQQPLVKYGPVHTCGRCVSAQLVEQ